MLTVYLIEDVIKCVQRYDRLYTEQAKNDDDIIIPIIEFNYSFDFNDVEEFIVRIHLCCNLKDLSVLEDKIVVRNEHDLRHLSSLLECWLCKKYEQ